MTIDNLKVNDILKWSLVIVLIWKQQTVLGWVVRRQVLVYSQKPVQVAGVKRNCQNNNIKSVILTIIKLSRYLLVSEILS